MVARASSLQYLYNLNQQSGQLNDYMNQSQFTVIPPSVGLTTLTSKKKKEGIMQEYFNKNKNIIITIAIAIMADHFFFKGKLREKLMKTIEDVIDSAKGQ